MTTIHWITILLGLTLCVAVVVYAMLSVAGDVDDQHDRALADGFDERSRLGVIDQALSELDVAWDDARGPGDGLGRA